MFFVTKLIKLLDLLVHLSIMPALCPHTLHRLCCFAGGEEEGDEVVMESRLGVNYTKK